MNNYRTLEEGEVISVGDEFLNEQKVWVSRTSVEPEEILHLVENGGKKLPHRRKVEYPEHTPPAAPEGMIWEYRGEAWSNAGEKTIYYMPGCQVCHRVPDGLENIHYFEAVIDLADSGPLETLPPFPEPPEGMRWEYHKNAFVGGIGEYCFLRSDRLKWISAKNSGGRFNDVLKAVPDPNRCRATIPESTEPPYTEEELMENPKESAGRKKCPMHLLSPSAMRETANALGSGSIKYGPRNYRETGVNATTYVGAILRHVSAWNDGEDLDPESGLSHIAHVAACCDILLDCAATGMLNDDRSKKPLQELTIKPG